MLDEEELQNFRRVSSHWRKQTCFFCLNGSNSVDGMLQTALLIFVINTDILS